MDTSNPSVHSEIILEFVKFRVEVAMYTIIVEKISIDSFQVTVEGKACTQHLVTVHQDYAARLTHGKVSTETLVEKSFEFLLDREPNTSILRTFDLKVISQYFSEYETEIAKYLIK